MAQLRATTTFTRPQSEMARKKVRQQLNAFIEARSEEES